MNEKKARRGDDRRGVELVNICDETKADKRLKEKDGLSTVITEKPRKTDSTSLPQVSSQYCSSLNSKYDQVSEATENVNYVGLMPYVGNR